MPSRCQFPFLKELHTQVEFKEYPSVKSLGLYMMYPPSQQILAKIPETVKILRIHVTNSGKGLTPEELEKNISPVVDRVIQLMGCKLEAFYLNLPALLSSDVLRLAAFSLRNNIRNYCTAATKPNDIWNPYFETRISNPVIQPGIIKLLNWIYQRKLMQFTALQKYNSLRMVPKVYTEELIESALSYS